MGHSNNKHNFKNNKQSFAISKETESVDMIWLKYLFKLVPLQFMLPSRALPVILDIWISLTKTENFFLLRAA